MTTVQPLSADALYTRTDPATLPFDTTSDLAQLDEIIGQDRAVEAVEFGVGIRRAGFNIYALGSRGTGRHELVGDFLRQQAAQEATPSDWCYVYNFDNRYKPMALCLPPGEGSVFARRVDQLVDELIASIPAAFETEDYRLRRQAIEERFRQRQEEAFHALQTEARSKELDLLRTPNGLVFAPTNVNNEVIEPDEFQKLPEDQKEHIRGKIDEMQKKLQQALQEVPEWERAMRQELRALNEEVAHITVEPLFEELVKHYEGEQDDRKDLRAYLRAMQKDVLEHLNWFRQSEEPSAERSEEETSDPRAQAQPGEPPQHFTRYRVNVLVDRSGSNGAPVIYEDNPAYPSLVGRVEYMTRMGGMDTDFTLIRAGALHRANGGFLMLDARRLLLEPYAWEGLKRALRAGQIRIETPGQMMSQVNVITLEPEPIPLDVKVVLVGDRALYYMLSQNDPDFDELFKVAADFEDVMDRTPETEQAYALLIASLAHDRNLRPLDREATARVIEESARMAGDAHRLSMQTVVVTDLLQEADYWAAQTGDDLIQRKHVEETIQAQEYRSGRIPERSREAILQETIRIDTEGAVVGQINGLSVLDLGKIRFGKPTRISARVRMGRGEVVDIEREVALSGQIHSKGVLILASFLSSRYATEYPLSLHASLVFEQSYGGVDGDSASSTELYALLSALSEVPIQQQFAVTGSVDQFGNIQAIGGVNEKIEGFFAICKERGLTGTQGVLIPRANVRHLMLRQPVVEAVAAGQFHIYPVETIDQGIEILTGVPAGKLGKQGNYPQGSINRRVRDRLHSFAQRWISFHRVNGAGGALDALAAEQDAG